MESTFRMERIEKEGNIPAKIIHQQVSGNDLFVSPHWHKEVELNLMLMREGYFLVDGNKKVVEPGEIIIINSGVIHSGFVMDNRVHQELITILWDYKFFSEFHMDIDKYQFAMSKDPAIRKKIWDSLIQVALLSKEKMPLSEMKIISLLYEVGYLLLNYCLEKKPHRLESGRENKNEIILKAIGYIENNYKDEITLEIISKRMGMAPTYFSKKFRQVTGIGFHEFLIQCRVKNARNDLMNTEMSITEAAYNNGFQNVKSFIEYFKKYFSTTPKQYLKQNRY